MEQEVEEVISELNRLFGRLRYALMEAQSSLAWIAGRARDREGQAESARVKALGDTRLGKADCPGTRRARAGAGDGEEPSVPRSMPRRIP